MVALSRSPATDWCDEVKKKGRELNAPCPEAPTSACHRKCAKPRPLRARARSVSVTGLENCRFSGQPVAVATLNCFQFFVSISSVKFSSLPRSLSLASTGASISTDVTAFHCMSPGEAARIVKKWTRNGQASPRFRSFSSRRFHFPGVVPRRQYRSSNLCASWADW